MRKFITLLLIILLALTAMVAIAQDDPFAPDDDDNECYDGGLLSRADSNGCESEWAWTCGWYLDSWLDNGGWANDNNFFPDWCAPESLLPPKPEVDEPEAGSSGGRCIGFDKGKDYESEWELDKRGLDELEFVTYLDFGNSDHLPVGTTVYLDNTCTIDSGDTLTSNVVYSPSGDHTVTNALCDAYFGPGIWGWPSTSGGIVWRCEPGT